MATKIVPDNLEPGWFWCGIGYIEGAVETVAGNAQDKGCELNLGENSGNNLAG
jgi:hypothetical protein